MRFALLRIFFFSSVVMAVVVGTYYLGNSGWDLSFALLVFSLLAKSRLGKFVVRQENRQLSFTRAYLSAVRSQFAAQGDYWLWIPLLVIRVNWHLPDNVQ